MGKKNRNMLENAKNGGTVRSKNWEDDPTANPFEYINKINSRTLMVLIIFFVFFIGGLRYSYSTVLHFNVHVLHAK